MYRILKITSIILLFILVVSSCKTIVPTASVTTITKDSIVYIPKDTTVYLTDSAGFRALLECDSLGEIRIKQIKDYYAGQFVKPKIIIKDNYVSVDCKVDSAKIYVAWKEKHEIITTSSVTVKVDRQNYLTGWQWFQVWCGRVAMVVIGVVLIIFIIKTYTKIQIPLLK